ncbi:fatty acid synthase-like [Vespula pensylvanica]|uniref:fatty acid synthase-like n=1 Tax=Vespula pensylvanica TaxID=30213 RepID=UPI001CB9D9C2|nr:fatty acid synthase-like [Vespula pensylvanica]
MQSTLLKKFYEECGVSTTCIPYIEAHGTGTRVGDPEELNSIDQIFTKDRTNPLKVGSVKSSMGHPEGVSGICSIVKAILSMESGIIPPNINFSEPRKDSRCLIEGRIDVVTKHTPLDGEYIGINSFGFGGANAHVLLKSNPKIKIDKGLPDDDLPRLVAVSGRTTEAVETILNEIDKRPRDIEFIRLLHDIHYKAIPGHLYRGYIITDTQQSDTKVKEIQNFSGTQKPICFVFPGMDSQWSGMYKALMKFPTFAKAIEKCDAVLKPRKLHIYEILTKTDISILGNILYSFVGIAAVQIGLVDLLTSVGILPDCIIGYSVGELGCAYADGMLTLEETMLAAYSQGISVIEYVRGNRLDYDKWARMGNTGWSYEEVLPYFLKSEDNRNPYLQKSPYHKTGGYLTVQEPPWRSPLSIAFLQAGQELGYENRDINGESQTGFMIMQGTIRRGSRCSTAKAFLWPVKNRPNLHIAMKAQVLKVLFNADKRATGIEFLRDGLKQTVRVRREIILSAGAINSPQLLMLSGIGPKEHLEELGIPVLSDLRVGDNLQDHVGLGGLSFTVDEPITLKRDRLQTLPIILNYAINNKGPLTTPGIEALAFINSKYADPSGVYPDIQFHFLPIATTHG